MNDIWIFILLIVVIIFFYISHVYQYEAFVNISSPVIIDPMKLHIPNKPYLWTYKNTDDIKNLNLSNLYYESIKNNCIDNFNIVILTNKTIYKYLPEMRKDLDDKLLNIPMKIDYYKYQLLYKYGGIWIDYNTIVMRNLTPLIDKLKNYDYVGFNNFYNSKDSPKEYSNRILIGNKENILFKKCIEACDNLLDNKPSSYFDNNQQSLGKNLLEMTIKHCHEDVPGWKYYRYPSKCLERDSIKLNNGKNKEESHTLISNRNIDEVCKDSYYVVPIYNIEFPKWFKDLSKVGIIKSNTLIANLFKLALGL
jgi:hypothetical protein